MYGRGIKDSGWQRSNHRVEIELVTDREEGGPRASVFLMCPPCCPTTANNHLLITERTEQGFPKHIGSVPLGAYLGDGGWTRDCMADYEHTSRGLIDGWDDTPWGDTLCEESAKHLSTLPDGVYEYEIEFGAEYGWSDSGPWGPAEYEWNFYWRLIHV